MNRAVLAPALLALCALTSACKEEEASRPPRMTVEELKDPKNCMGCHPTHYQEWKASMHAYASDDPVFQAMNALGQEETDGKLGNLCINCHAPMAVKEGYVENGELKDNTPEHMKGITCYFCHNVESVTGENNAEVKLYDDTVMRGTIWPDPVEPSAHGVSFSRFLDPANPESNNFCGGCHDIKLENGVHLERTFAEYKESIFADTGSDGYLGCVSCHMTSRDNTLAAIDDGLANGAETIGSRTTHSHLWPGVDVALTSWPDREAYEAAVQCALDSSINIRDDNGETGPDEETGGIRYLFETSAGHKMPSGASQDRRLWVEMIAYADDSKEAILCSRGVVPDDKPVTEAADTVLCAMSEGSPSVNDPIQFPLFRDQIFDEEGNETHMFWRAAPSEEFDSGVFSDLLPAATAIDPVTDEIADHFVALGYVPHPDATYDTVRVKMRPMDFDVLKELIDEGFLSESIRDEIPTFTIDSASVDFNLVNGIWRPTRVQERGYDCDCVFDPDGPGCDE